ncbi:MAG: DUF5666 domain-containing protein [Candidatus Shapirobacteria bacterium]|jgi:hypothetical protein
MKTNLPVTIVLVIISAAVGFFGGLKYQQSKAFPFRNSDANGNRMLIRNGQPVGQNGQAGRSGFRPVNGEIMSADAKTITVKLPDGGSKIVLVTDQTEISKFTQASQPDLATGQKVAAFGTENPDGSITAQSIQLNPQSRLRPTVSTTP